MKLKSEITTQQDPEALARMNDIMQQAGQAANMYAARVVLEDQTARNG